MDNLGKQVLQTVLGDFHKYKTMAEQAFAQLADDNFYRQTGAEQNSIAVIIQHLTGNMRSRWTDFLTTDGEKPERHRDQEFIEQNLSREELLRRWEAGWVCLFAALTPLTGADLLRTVYIRREPHTVFQAINRQTCHYAYHIGQIVQLAEQFSGDTWQTLSVAKGKTEEFNREMGM